MDVAELAAELRKHQAQGIPLMIGSFSAASNVTGIRAPVHAITELLHRCNALSFWDYATAGPYDNIDMNPVVDGPGAPYVYKDAVFLSPHKFVGGPGAPGILIAKKTLFENRVPAKPGGGTVFFVTSEDHRYLSNRIEREEGGTPDILGSIRASMAFQVKSWIAAHEMEALERAMSTRVFSWLDKHAPNIHVLGAGAPVEGAGGCRLPIVSFVLKFGDRFLHYNFVSAVLNDVFGIQARGGCACAGPYAHHLRLSPQIQSASKLAFSRKGAPPPWIHPAELSILYESRRCRVHPRSARSRLSARLEAAASIHVQPQNGRVQSPLANDKISFRRWLGTTSFIPTARLECCSL